MLIALVLGLMWKKWMVLGLAASFFRAWISILLASLVLIATSYLLEYFIKIMCRMYSTNRIYAFHISTLFPYRNTDMITRYSRR